VLLATLEGASVPTVVATLHRLLHSRSLLPASGYIPEHLRYPPKGVFSFEAWYGFRRSGKSFKPAVKGHTARTGR
jgi:hypothetical protein